jgi:peptidoglycan/LPS O-acetylase OafA/YrhL
LWTMPIGRRPRVAVTVAVALGAIAVGVLHAFAASPDRFIVWDWSIAIKFGVPFSLGVAVAATGLLDRRRLILVGAAVAAVAAFAWAPLTFQGNRTVAAVVIAIGILALGHSRLLRRLVPTPFGDLSYGIYLYGFVVEELVLTQAVGLGDVGIAVTAFTITLCVAAASWRFVERPALKYKAKTSQSEPAGPQALAHHGGLRAGTPERSVL